MQTFIHHVTLPSADTQVLNVSFNSCVVHKDKCKQFKSYRIAYIGLERFVAKFETLSCDEPRIRNYLVNAIVVPFSVVLCNGTFSNPFEKERSKHEMRSLGFGRLHINEHTRTQKPERISLSRQSLHACACARILIYLNRAKFSFACSLYRNQSIPTRTRFVLRSIYVRFWPEAIVCVFKVV